MPLTVSWLCNNGGAESKGFTPSHQRSDSVVRATSPDYCNDLNEKDNKNHADLIAVDEQLKNTGLNTKLLDLNEACFRGVIVASSSVINVINFAFERVLPPAAGDIPFIDTLRRNAKV